MVKVDKKEVKKLSRMLVDKTKLKKYSSIEQSEEIKGSLKTIASDSKNENILSELKSSLISDLDK
jgi:hypothetical protein